MATELIMMKGLPASGKSTWAISEVLEASAGEVVRINKDTLRAMLHADRWKGKKTERQVLAARDALIRTYLDLGLRVIVDDTNLAPFHEEKLRDIALEFGAGFRVQDFTHVPLDVCLERDWKREKSVGPEVIYGMWRQYMQPPVRTWDGQPPAIIVDLDGTLAHFDGRSPYDFTKVETDLLDTVVAGLAAGAHDLGWRVLLVSGRDEVARQSTSAWLHRHGVQYEALWMRPAGDNRPDREVKAELYHAHIEGRFDIKYVLDDRDSVVAMWRSKGLKVLQVAYGAF